MHIDQWALALRALGRLVCQLDLGLAQTTHAYITRCVFSIVSRKMTLHTAKPSYVITTHSFSKSSCLLSTKSPYACLFGFKTTNRRASHWRTWTWKSQWKLTKHFLEKRRVPLRMVTPCAPKSISTFFLLVQSNVRPSRSTSWFTYAYP